MDFVQLDAATNFNTTLYNITMALGDLFFYSVQDSYTRIISWGF